MLVPIMLSKVPGERVKVTLVTPNIMGQGRDNSMTLRSEVAVSTILKEIQQRNW
jgi:hypothetical protein